MTSSLRPRIAVLGGGFGGLSTALKLVDMRWTRLTRPEITLIDRSERFGFLPMMYELATGEVESWEVAPTFTDVLQDFPTIKYKQAAVTGLDLDSNEGILVRTDGDDDGDTDSSKFDRVVVALGAECANIETVKGAAEYALPFYTVADSFKLREKLRELRASRGSDKINIVVIGGGYSGVELATTIADNLREKGSVTLVERGDMLLKASGSSHNRGSASRALLDRGVLLELGTSIHEITENSVSLKPTVESETLEDIHVRPADLVLWTAGSKPNTVISSLNSSIPTDGRGRVEVDDYLQIRGYENRAFALGDNSAYPSSDQGYSGTAQVAMQQAEYAAWNCWASLTDKSMLRYRYAHLGEMLVLGKKDASIETILGVKLEGPTAWASRRAGYLARMPTDRHRMRVALSWAAHPLLKGIEKAAANAATGSI